MMIKAISPAAHQINVFMPRTRGARGTGKGDMMRLWVTGNLRSFIHSAARTVWGNKCGMASRISTPRRAAGKIITWERPPWGRDAWEGGMP